MNNSTQFVSATTRDPAEYELVLRPWELQCLPQSAGNFEHTITAIQSPSFIIYRENYQLAAKIQGMSPEGMLAFAIPLNFTTQPRFWGDRLAETEIPGLLPGPVDVDFGAGQTILVVLVKLDFLLNTLSPTAVARLQSAAQSRRFAAPARTIRNFAWWGCSLLDAALAQPKQFKQPAIAESILHELVDFLVLLSDQKLESSTAQPAARRRGLERALEFLRYRLDSRVSIGELCREAGVCERSLQTAFQEEFGFSPTEFMRRRRLHAARQKLLASSRGETTVAKIALECGFYEFGRFAVEYRRHFGICPSATLASKVADSLLANRRRASIWES